MPRVFLIPLLALLLLVPATAEGSSSVRLRGTVTAKNATSHLVSVKAARQAFSLRVPGTLVAIHRGQRVELRGSTLRAQGRGSDVLARGVSLVSSQPLSATASPQSSSAGLDDDEIEIKGTLMSLSPVTVASATRTVSCTAPAGTSLAGLVVGDLVEMTCDRVDGAWVVRKVHLEDEDDERATGQDDDEDDDDDSSGPGSGDDDGEDDD